MAFNLLCHYLSSFSVNPYHDSSNSKPASPKAGFVMMREGLGNNKRTSMGFPYVSEPQRNMMIDLVSTVETRLDSHLLPCTLPENVRRYQNQDGTSQASLHIRSGRMSSQIDFILGSWIHCELPKPGGSLDITSFSCYLNSSTDAPNFLMDMIQNSPTSLILLLDLKPRKDLVLYPEYLQTFYENTTLESQRQLLERTPEVKPYFTPSIYIRSFLSPTAIMVRIEAGSEERIEGIVRDLVHPVANEVLRVWLDKCAFACRELGDEERVSLHKRDKLAKAKTLEAELGNNLPRLFGPDVADRVLVALKEYFFA